MKKLLFTCTILLFIFTNVEAQTNFGLKGGVNFATFTGDNTALIATRTSVHAGFMLEVQVSEKISFQPELMYSAQGAKIEEDIFDLELLKSTTKLSYINLPLMFKFYASEGFNFQFGPQVGFLVGAKTSLDVPLIGGSTEEDVKELFESVDFGLNFGLGYKLDSGLNFDARYNLGLTNISVFDEGGKTKNGVFQLSIGYFFN